MSRSCPSKRRQLPFSIFFFALAQSSSSWQKKVELAVQKPTNFSSAEIRPERKRPGRRRRRRDGQSSPITVALRARIFATRSWRRARRLAAGRNRAPTCAARFCIARPKCWKCAERTRAEVARAMAARARPRKKCPGDRPAGPLRGLDGQIQPALRRGESGRQLALQFHHAGTNRRGCYRLPRRTFAARPRLAGRAGHSERQHRGRACLRAKPLPALTFSEIIATSDLPGGVVNILAGDRAELAPHFASHMDVNAIVDGSGDEKIGADLQRGGAFNVKRYVAASAGSGGMAGRSRGKSLLDSRHRRNEDRLAPDRALREGKKHAPRRNVGKKSFSTVFPSSCTIRS